MPPEFAPQRHQLEVRDVAVGKCENLSRMPVGMQSDHGRVRRPPDRQTDLLAVPPLVDRLDDFGIGQVEFPDPAQRIPHDGALRGELCLVRQMLQLAPAAVVLGGGGYNPWTVTRYWTGLWGTLSGRTVPALLPEAARGVLAGLHCDLIDDEDILVHWLTTLADPANEGSVREEIETMRDQAWRQADAAQGLVSEGTT